ncbi:unnamed protein product [Meloidogyne enterolobii]|uniref:Uncharacterized protein n=1 Tax=Meloidogyne enterolobii TaxID=390850 RepID=A0ACB0XWH5_MELEN
MNFRLFIFYGKFCYFRGTSKGRIEIRDYPKNNRYNQNCPFCCKYCPIITRAWILIFHTGKNDRYLNMYFWK